MRAFAIPVLAVVGILTGASGAVGQPSEPDIPPAPQKSPVFYIIEPAAIGERRTTNRAVVRRMVEALVMAMTGERTPGAAWARWVSPSDTVGIKVAASGGPVSGTRRDVVRAVVEGLKEAGVPPANIIVWDRNKADLLAAGFDPESTDYRLRWIDPVSGYDDEAPITAPLLGKLIWGDAKFGRHKEGRLADLLSSGDQLSNQSFLSRVLTREVTKVVHIPSLSDSFLTGIHGALAGMVISNIDNWRRFTRPPQFGDPYLAEIYADPAIHGKVVLTLLDGLFLQYAGGPFPNPNFTIENFALFASPDPVAIDATARRLINETRVEYRLPKVDGMTRYIDSATYIGLGASREEDIDLIRIGTDSAGQNREIAP